MKIFISEADRQSARRIALKNIARFFDISDWESKTNEDLQRDIYSLTDISALEIIKLLKEYFKAYDEWFLFYQERKKNEEKQGEEYYLTSKEKLELGKLINKREKSLNALQLKFNELQLLKFNRKTFGDDISGIIKDK
jgi:hypothetical protein